MREQVELLVDLDQLEGGAGSPVLLLSQAVVGIAFVFGGFSHFQSVGDTAYQYVNVSLYSAHCILVVNAVKYAGWRMFIFGGEIENDFWS